MRRLRILFSSDDHLKKAAEALYGTGLFEIVKCGINKMELLSAGIVYDPAAIVLGAGDEMMKDSSELVPTIVSIQRSSLRASIFVVIKGALKTEVPIPEGVEIIRFISSRQVAEEILLKMYSSDLPHGDSGSGRNMNSYIYEVADELGLTANYSGMTYIIEALKAMISGEISANCSFSKSVYPMIATRFSVSPSSAERSIRRAIVRSWERMEPKYRVKYFGALYDIEKTPGNREYIMIIYDKLCRSGL